MDYMMNHKQNNMIGRVLAILIYGIEDSFGI